MEVVLRARVDVPRSDEIDVVVVLGRLELRLPQPGLGDSGKGPLADLIDESRYRKALPCDDTHVRVVIGLPLSQIADVLRDRRGSVVVRAAMPNVDRDDAMLLTKALDDVVDFMLARDHLCRCR